MWRAFATCSRPSRPLSSTCTRDRAAHGTSVANRTTATHGHLPKPLCTLAAASLPLLICSTPQLASGSPGTTCVAKLWKLRCHISTLQLSPRHRAVTAGVGIILHNFRRIMHQPPKGRIGEAREPLTATHHLWHVCTRSSYGMRLHGRPTRPWNNACHACD